MYLKYYGLEQRPFDMTPDPDFLFFTGKHREAFAHLVYGIREGQGFIEISGEVGAGKTTLCRAILQEFEEAEIRLALVLSPMLSDVELLQAICDELLIEVKGRTKKELLDSINAYLIEQHTLERKVVLIIDEAQNLPDETLEQVRILSNLETEKEKLLQIILVGQPELREKLAQHHLRQLNQRISVRYHLGAMDRKETEQYISYRLAIAGSEGQVQFTRKALDLIFRYSEGIPRKVNVLCDRILLLGYVRETRVVDPEIVRDAIAEVTGENARKGKRSGRFRRLVEIPIAACLCFVAAFLVLREIREHRVEDFGLLEGIRVAVAGAGDALGWTALRPSADQASPEFPGEQVESPPVIPEVMIEPTETLTPSPEPTDTPLPPTWTPTLTETPVPPSPTFTNTSTPEPTFTLTATWTPTHSPIPWIPPEDPQSNESPKDIQGDFDELGLFRIDDLRGSRAACAVTLAGAMGSGPIELTWAFLRVHPGGEPIESVLASLGFDLRDIIIPPRLLRILTIPIILEIPEEKGTRFSILTGIYAGTLYLADPVEGYLDLPETELTGRWFGRITVCLPSEALVNTRMTEGSTGVAVARLKGRLVQAGYLAGERNDRFGPETTAALATLQRDKGLPINGLATLETQIVLFAMTAGEEIPRIRISEDIKP